MNRAAILLSVACGLIWAQPADDAIPAASNVLNAQYPRIHPDLRATFRLNAPDAHKVQVGIGRARYDMSRRDDGLWYVTTPPLVPGFHYYSFIVDGASVADPSSHTYIGGSRDSSGIEVPEAGVDFYEPKNVPHGEVRMRWYLSKVTGQWRRCFVYEWATREGSPTPNFGAALGDAAFLTGLERNSDIVIMAAYAPLFVNVNPGGMQWSSDLIGYDALNSYGLPSYYMQVMFASCLGDHTLGFSATGVGDRFFHSETASPNKLCLKLVNASSAEQKVGLNLRGLGDGAHTARVSTLRANTTWATNTITAPRRIVPVTSTMRVNGERLSYVVPPFTIQVLEIPLGPDGRAATRD